MDSVFHKQVRMDGFSGTREDSNRRQSDPAVLMTTERGSFNMQNDQMEKLTKTVEQIAGHMTTLRSDMTTLRSDMATLRSDMTTWRSDATIGKKMMDEDIRSMKPGDYVEPPLYFKKLLCWYYVSAGLYQSDIFTLCNTAF